MITLHLIQLHICVFVFHFIIANLLAFRLVRPFFRSSTCSAARAHTSPNIFFYHSSLSMRTRRYGFERISFVGALFMSTFVREFAVLFTFNCAAIVDCMLKCYSLCLRKNRWFFPPYHSICVITLYSIASFLPHTHQIPHFFSLLLSTIDLLLGLNTLYTREISTLYFWICLK